jgi:hypothetical protein
LFFFFFSVCFIKQRSTTGGATKLELKKSSSSDLKRSLNTRGSFKSFPSAILSDIVGKDLQKEKEEQRRKERLQLKSLDVREVNKDCRIYIKGAHFDGNFALHFLSFRFFFFFRV